MATDLIYKSAQSTESFLDRLNLDRLGSVGSLALQELARRSRPATRNLSPELASALAGSLAADALLGAMVGALLELRKEKERRSYPAGLLLGGLAGGGAGLLWKLLGTALAGSAAKRVLSE